MKAMILAAGRGERLRPLTDNIPKCMIPVGDKPLLEHTIERLSKCGVKDIIINLCHLSEKIMDHFGDGRRWGINIQYSMEKQLLGTAGGVRNVSWFFDEPFLVWYGDNICTCDLERLFLFHSTKGGVATIALYQRSDVSQSGIVGVDGYDQIIRFLEKPTAEQAFSNLVNAGVYVLDPRVFRWIPEEGSSDFARDVFPAMLADNQPLFGYRLSSRELLWWIDRPEDLDNLNKRWKTQ